MSSRELLLLGGPPWSGKSSIAKCFVKLGQPPGTNHLSIGELKRGIVAGEIPSAYADQLEKRPRSYTHHSVVSGKAILGIFEEFIARNPSPLTVVDGFPRYPDRLEIFRESVQRLGASVIAFCKVEADEVVLRERSLYAREGRSPKTAEEIENRFADHNETIAPTLDILAQDYPSYTLDGTAPLEENASNLLTIYERYTNTKTLRSV